MAIPPPPDGWSRFLVKSTFGAGNELSDADLETVSGGCTFPQTDWSYHGNTCTNGGCTLTC